MIQNLKQNWLPFQNWHEEFDKFWPEHLKISKICTLMGCFWPKYIMFELKKCRTVRFDHTEYWCKIWRKNELRFQKWHRNLANFHQSMFESLNIGTLMGSFYLKYKICELKINGGLLCHENGEWCKIWRGIDLSVQNWHEELWPEHPNLDPSTWKSQKFAL